MADSSSGIPVTFLKQSILPVAAPYLYPKANFVIPEQDTISLGESIVPYTHIANVVSSENTIQFSIYKTPEIKDNPQFVAVFTCKDEQACQALLSILPPTTTPEFEHIIQEQERFYIALLENTPHTWVSWIILFCCIASFIGYGIVFGLEAVYAPMTLDLIRYGADFGPCVYQGEYWRMITSAFIHIGILHIIFNMYVLLAIGPFIERLYGNVLFLLIYFGSAFTGSFLSLVINPEIVSAGASGAIFGLFGAMVAYIIRNRREIPQSLITPYWKDAMYFIGVNLVIGFTVPGIDNFCHLGGLVGGFCFGLVSAPSTDSQKRATFMPLHVMLCSVLIAITVYAAYSVLPSRLSAGMGEYYFSMGECYRTGEGVVKDSKEALKWYRKAAEQGMPDAQFKLGVIYGFGQGVEKDDTQAVEWYRKAAEQGMPEAQYNLGVHYSNGLGVEKDYTQAVEWYRKAAEQGMPEAQYNLGVHYSNSQGVEKDDTQAVEWYRKAAEQGEANAQCNLGIHYGNGQGVEKDYTQAVKWYRKAAEKDNAIALFYLGNCYKKGRGVEKSDDEALKLFLRASELGFEDANKEIEKLKRRMKSKQNQ